VLHVGLDGGVVELSADESLGVEDGVGRVHGHLVLGGVADQTLGVCEGDIRRGRAVTLAKKNKMLALGMVAVRTEVFTLLSAPPPTRNNYSPEKQIGGIRTLSMGRQSQSQFYQRSLLHTFYQ
jgi:hypothetical protein